MHQIKISELDHEVVEIFTQLLKTELMATFDDKLSKKNETFKFLLTKCLSFLQVMETSTAIRIASVPMKLIKCAIEVKMNPQSFFFSFVHCLQKSTITSQCRRMVS